MVPIDEVWLGPGGRSLARLGVRSARYYGHSHVAARYKRDHAVDVRISPGQTSTHAHLFRPGSGPWQCPQVFLGSTSDHQPLRNCQRSALGRRWWVAG
jgi:hypothetical protein